MNELDNNLKKQLPQSEPWYKSFFNEFYWDLFMRRNAQEIKREVNTIVSLIENPRNTNTISPGPKSILDICCGVGDILEGLAVEYKIPGYLTQGIEYSPDYVRLARSRAHPLKIIEGDALDFYDTYPAQFDLVLNWFSSYAYFEPAQTQQLLNNCFKYCAPNGVFLLEAYSAEAVLNNFQKLFLYNITHRGKTYHIERHSQIVSLENQKLSQLQQTWIFKNNEGLVEHSYDTLTYMYNLSDIEFMLKNAGFQDIEMFGRTKNYDIISSEHLNATLGTTPRFVVKAQK